MAHCIELVARMWPIFPNSLSQLMNSFQLRIRFVSWRSSCRDPLASSWLTLWPTRSGCRLYTNIAIPCIISNSGWQGNEASYCLAWALHLLESRSETTQSFHQGTVVATFFSKAQNSVHFLQECLFCIVAGWTEELVPCAFWLASGADDTSAAGWFSISGISWRTSACSMAISGCSSLMFWR